VISSPRIIHKIERLPSEANAEDGRTAGNECSAGRAATRAGTTQGREGSAWGGDIAYGRESGGGEDRAWASGGWVHSEALRRRESRPKELKWTCWGGVPCLCVGILSISPTHTRSPGYLVCKKRQQTRSNKVLTHKVEFARVLAREQTESAAIGKYLFPTPGLALGRKAQDERLGSGSFHTP
jgi:hypothetical protein